MALDSSYEDTVAEIERIKTLLEKMEDKLGEMEKVLAEMPDEGSEEHRRTRMDRQHSINRKLDWISSKYDEIIAKELELQRADEQAIELYRDSFGSAERSQSPEEKDDCDGCM